MSGLLAAIFPRFDLPQASSFAAPFDRLYDFIFWTSTASFIVIFLGLVVFTHRYARRRRGERTPRIEGHTPTEVGVIVILFIWVMVIFGWGWRDYHRMRTMPSNAVEVNVIARQWAWEFQYPNGRTLMNELTLPRGRAAKLLMTSADVIHSFFVPNFRVKQDVLPGTYTALWFEPTQSGTHDVFCAEFCGTGHSQMLAQLSVVEPAEYDQWQLDWELQALASAATAATAQPGALAAAGAAPVSLAERGKALYAAKGCGACHSTDGSATIGPTHLKLFGRRETMKDGTTITVDENYLRESIVDPQAQVVQGFAPVMPTYKGQVTDEEMTALIEYLKGVR